MKKIVLGQKPEKHDYRKTVYGIVTNGDKLLVTYNPNLPEYSLVGGGLENNETLIDALKREFLEESGFLITEYEEFVNIDCFWRKKDGRIMETDANFLLCKVDLNNINKPLEDYHEPKWIDKNKILGLIDFPYQREALRFFFEKENLQK